MSQAISQAAIQFYVSFASRLLPIEEGSRGELTRELESDVFLKHGLSGVACKLYHNYGSWLAPLTVSLTTAKYCQFRAKPEASYLAEDVGNGRDETGDKPVGGDNPSD